MNCIELNANWRVRHEELHVKAESMAKVAARTDGWLCADLPCDVRMPLIENGIIPEPNIGDAYKQSLWIERKSWWFQKDFEMSAEQCGFEVAELALESLDAEADIFVNGVHLGHHKSAFYPFACDIKPHLRAGQNQLTIRLTTGLEYVSADDLAPIDECVSSIWRAFPNSVFSDRSDNRRVFLRKAQYVYGWDFGPRVVSCGIMKGAFLRLYNRFTIRSVYAATREIAPAAQLAFQVELEGVHPYSSAEADLRLVVSDPSGNAVVSIERDVFLRSGYNVVDMCAEIENPQLWWPTGMGGQPLYTVQVSVCCEGERQHYPPFKLGIRTIGLNIDRIDHERRGFAFEVNGERVFIKGANWVPPDTIFARNREEKFEALILEAKASHTNMLRIWGGGIYEPDAFYEKCDQHGLLVWHDFMFLCGLYPDNLAWFRDEVEREMDHQTTQLRNHACMALWCGNNENFWLIQEQYAPKFEPPFLGGVKCYNELAPRAVRKNCPEIPYWNGSPYGGANPNASVCGDQHMYGVLYSDSQKNTMPESYDRYEVQFPSEFSTKGPSGLKTTQAYMGGAPMDRDGDIWLIHTNTIAVNLISPAIAMHYTDPAPLSTPDYLRLGGIWQGLMLGYPIESFRHNAYCQGMIYWKIDDIWGEIGSGIVDYYLRRKIPFYFVKRAYAPIILIMRREGAAIRVMGINDTREPVDVTVEYGYTRFDGAASKTREAAIHLPPRSRECVLTMEDDGSDTQSGAFFVSPKGTIRDIAPAILRTNVFKELNATRPGLRVSDFRVAGADAVFTVEADAFAHAVHFNLDEDLRLSDEFFDMLPGESREITIFDAAASCGKPDIRPASILVR